MFKAIFTREEAAGEPSALLRLQGSATIQFCVDLRAAFLDALGKTESLSVDVSGITEIDVSALQLFCAARRSAIGSGKQMVLSKKIADVFRSAVVEAGFYRTHTASCWLAAGQSCLWHECQPAGRRVAP